MKFWYLATPYSAYADGLEAAHREAARNLGILLRAGVVAVSPIAGYHAAAMLAGIDPRIANPIWAMTSHALLAPAHGLIVCMMDGWDASVGVAAEIQQAEFARKEVAYMLPGAVPERFVPRPER